MKGLGLNVKSFKFKYAVCLAAMLGMVAGYWIWTRSQRVERAGRVASQTAEHVQARIREMQNIADVMAAWLDTKGDSGKKAIAASEDGTEYLSEFEHMAESLYNPETMTSVQLVPDGMVRYVYPTDENEGIIGMDAEEKWGSLLKDSASSGSMTTVGPTFISKQGLMLEFFMPVCYEDGRLWGYTALALRMPDALMSLTLERLPEEGYDYVLRYLADVTAREEHIAGTAKILHGAASAGFKVQDTKWVLYVRPKAGWISIAGVIISVLGAVLGAYVLTWVLEKWRISREATMSQLRSDAKHDKMTGLLNHTASAEAIDTALQTVEGGVLLLIDVDNFKTINDSAGHLAGDEVLVEIANAMRTTFRKYDILGRYGGDEFIVYMVGDISIPDFSVKASQFQRKIRKIPIGDTGRCVTCSIGGARRCVETPSAESLVQRADKALYTSKGTGKDRFTIFDDAGSTLVVTPEKEESKKDNDFTVSE